MKKHIYILIIVALSLLGGKSYAQTCNMHYVSKTDATCGNVTGAVTYDQLPAEAWRIEATSISVPNITFAEVTGNSTSVTLNGLIAGVGYKFRLITDAGCVSNETDEVIISAANNCDVNNFAVMLSAHHEACTNNGAIVVNMAGVIAGASLDVRLLQAGTELQKTTISVAGAANTANYTFNSLSAGDYTVEVIQTSGGNTSTAKNTNVTILNKVEAIVFNVTQTVGCMYSFTANVTAGQASQYRIVKKDDGAVIHDWQASNVFADIPAPAATVVYQMQVKAECGDQSVQDLTLNPAVVPTFGYMGYAQLVSCDKIRFAGKITAGAEPISVVVKQVDASGDEVSTTTAVLTGNDFVAELPYKPSSGLKAVVTATNCGGSTSKEIAWAHDGGPGYYIVTLGAACGGTYKKLDATFAGFYGNTTVQFTQAPEGFNPSEYEHASVTGGATYFTGTNRTSSPRPVADTYGGNKMILGGVNQPLPNGPYTIVVSDDCDPAHTVTKSFTISAPTGDDVYFKAPYDPYTACEDGMGHSFVGFYIKDQWGGINFSAPVLVALSQVKLTGPVNETLTIPASASYPVAGTHIRVVNKFKANDNQLKDGTGIYFEDLPLGSYEVEVTVDKAVCASLHDSYTYTLNIQENSLLKSDVIVKPLCSNFDVSIDFMGNMWLPKFFLQKWNASSGRWCHPIESAHVYPAEPTTQALSEYYGLEPTILSQSEPYANQNDVDMKSITAEYGNKLNALPTAQGRYRLVMQYRTMVGKGTKGNTNSHCIKVLKEFEYNYTGPKLIDTYVVKCTDGTSTIFSEVEGAAPLKYELIEVDGVVQTTPILSANAGAEPVFSGLNGAQYKIKVTDNCANEMVYSVSTSVINMPFLKKEGFCPGQNSKVYVDGLTYMQFEWTKDGTPIPASSTNPSVNNSVLAFTPFDPATHNGTYQLLLKYKTGSATPATICNTNLTMTIDANSFKPNTGENGSLSICSGKTVTTVELFAALGGHPETGGAWTPQPLAGAGTYTYTISKSTSCGDVTSSSTVEVTSKKCVDAKDDITQTPENTPVSGSVLTNDDGTGIKVTALMIDVDGDGTATSVAPGTETTLTNSSGTTIGTIVVNTDGTYTFTPANDYTGEVPDVTYTITDDNGVTDTAKLKINIVPATTGGNNPPVANDDKAVTEAGHTVTTNILSNDSDPDVGDIITITTAVLTDGYTIGNGGSATVAVDGSSQEVYKGGKKVGSIKISASGDVEFTPESDFTGTVPVDYTIKDKGDLTDTATLEIEVKPAGSTNGVYAYDDDVTGLFGQQLSIAPLANDMATKGNNALVLKTVDIQGQDGSYTTHTFPATGQSSPIIIYQNGKKVGSVVLNGDTKRVIFTPDYDFVGTVDVPYVAADGTAADANTDKAVMHFTTLSEVEARDDVTQTPQNTPVSGTVLANDYGDTIKVKALMIDVNGNGTATAVAPGAETPLTNSSGVTIGTIVVNTDGTYTFTPANDYTGEVPDVTYTIEDKYGNSDTAQLKISIIPDPVSGNNPPVANDDRMRTEEGKTVSTNILSNDSDVDGDELEVTDLLADTDGDGVADDVVAVGASVQQVYGKNIAGNTVIAGTLTVNSDGSTTFVPAAGFEGTVPAKYSMSDKHGGSDSANINIEVVTAGTTNGIFAYDDDISGLAGNPMTLKPLENDVITNGSTDNLVIGRVLIPDNDTDPSNDWHPFPSYGQSEAIDVYQGGQKVGSVVLDGDNQSVIFTPNADYVGTVDMPYSAQVDDQPYTFDVAVMHFTSVKPKSCGFLRSNRNVTRKLK